jgi:hypothetical protein
VLAAMRELRSDGADERFSDNLKCLPAAVGTALVLARGGTPSQRKRSLRHSPMQGIRKVRHARFTGSPPPGNHTLLRICGERLASSPLRISRTATQQRLSRERPRLVHQTTRSCSRAPRSWRTQVGSPMSRRGC